MNTSPFSEVFSSLLSINPWAFAQWNKRDELVRRGIWNIQHRNQAGNGPTSDWLKEFIRQRRVATRLRLQGPKNIWDVWSAETSRLIGPFQERNDFPRYMVGSQSYAATMPDYDIGSLWADIHLLTDADLSTEVFADDLDLNEYAFPTSLHAVGMKALRPVSAKRAVFGHHTSFAMSEFEFGADFQDACFGDWNGFVGTRFHGPASFSNTRFGVNGSFTATSFYTDANFNCASFEDNAEFTGANFRDSPDFSNARFMGRVGFVDATFSNGASFEDAWFPDRVFVHGIADNVIEAIKSADHSKTRPTN